MTDDSNNTQLASFGYEDVPPEEKVRRVGGVFSSVARRYDLMNDLMSFRLHRVWKDALVARLSPSGNAKVLDMAGGTGDVAERIARVLGRRGPRGLVALCDVNADMLAAGTERTPDRFVHTAPILRMAGDALRAPFNNQTFDGYTIAFGIRNVVDLDAALTEARRVLRPGGMFVCLEFSHPAIPVFKQAYDLYSFRVIPLIGRAVANDAASYRYLVESIRRFPQQDVFAAQIESAGFRRVGWRNLTGGVAALHWGWRS